MENKFTKGVFVDIMSSTPNEIESFIKQNKGLKSDKESSNLQKEYSTITNGLMDTFEKLSWLEELIIQYRSVNNISEIKFSSLRDYIYARTPFYRKTNKVKDIRVIVGKISEHVTGNEQLDTLYLKPSFIKLAKAKLGSAMLKEIEKNHSSYVKKYQNT